MTIEAALTRQFGITFIDARNLANEAKLKLNIGGYPTKEQREQLIEEAIKIYEARPEIDRKACRSRRMSLESVKSASGSSACSSVCSELDFDDFSVGSASQKNEEGVRRGSLGKITFQLKNVVISRRGSNGSTTK